MSSKRHLAACLLTFLLAAPALVGPLQAQVTEQLDQIVDILKESIKAVLG